MQRKYVHYIDINKGVFFHSFCSSNNIRCLGGEHAEQRGISALYICVIYLIYLKALPLPNST